MFTGTLDIQVGKISLTLLYVCCYTHFAVAINPFFSVSFPLRVLRTNVPFSSLFQYLAAKSGRRRTTMIIALIVAAALIQRSPLSFGTVLFERIVISIFCMFILGRIIYFQYPTAISSSMERALSGSLPILNPANFSRRNLQLCSLNTRICSDTSTSRSLLWCSASFYALTRSRLL